MSDKLMSLYKDLLATANATVVDGCVSVKSKKEPKPFTVNGKRLVLPTPEQLRNPDWSARVAFHPLWENTLQGESVVLTEFRRALNTRLNHVVGLLLIDLMELASSPAQQSHLTPEQAEFLKLVKDTDEKNELGTRLLQLIKAMPLNQTEKAFISLFIKRGALINGTKYPRGGIVNFPLYDELKKAKGPGKVYGVELRGKHRDMLVATLEYILPSIGEKTKDPIPVSTYSRGSKSDQAPSMDALMAAVYAVLEPIQNVVELFGDHLPAKEDLVVPAGWVDEFKNLDALMPDIRMIPMQKGNEGTPAVTAEVQPVQAAAAPAPQAPPPMAPAAPPQPQFAQAPQQPQAPAYPQGYPQAPQQPPQQPPAPPQPQETGRGVSFSSVVASNPALQQQLAYTTGYVPGMMPPPGMYPPPYQQPQTYAERAAARVPGYLMPQQQQQYPQQAPGYPAPPGYPQPYPPQYQQPYPPQYQQPVQGGVYPANSVYPAQQQPYSQPAPGYYYPPQQPPGRGF